MSIAITYKDSLWRKLKYIWNVSRLVQEHSGVSRKTIFREIALLYWHKRLGPLTYFEQALWREDFTMEDKLRCLTEEEYLARIAELNPPGFHSVSAHKVVEAAILRQAKIPVPEYLGFFNNGKGVDHVGRELTSVAHLKKLFEELAPFRVCFKPAMGGQGKGFFAVEVWKDHNGIWLHDLAKSGSTQTLDKFVAESLEPEFGEGYLLQRYVEQHAVLAKLNPSSVNTLRIWVLQDKREITIRGAILRVGRRGSTTDNTSTGGLRALVDIKTGLVGTISPATNFPEETTHHPDTGVAIAGVILPFWPETLAVAKEALRVLPRLNFTGLDIAITESGPVLIETNEEPARITARNFDAPLGDLLDPGRR